MDRHVKSFSEFLNEELNFERVSDTDCRLTRKWYYYVQDDDIVYGSDTVPSDGTIVVSFEKDEPDSVVMSSIDLNTGEYGKYVGEENVVSRINELFGEDIADLNDTETIQDFFDNDSDSRHILLRGRRILASSFDIIEEN